MIPACLKCVLCVLSGLNLDLDLDPDPADLAFPVHVPLLIFCGNYGDKQKARGAVRLSRGPKGISGI